MKEEWKEIDDFPGYQVSNLGKIKGPRKDELTPSYNKGRVRYPKVTLSKSGKHTDKRINRLVATAFIPNPNNKPLVMHLDNNPKNNRVDNLAWGDYSENLKHCWDCSRRPLTLNDDKREMAYAKRRTAVIAINCVTGSKEEFISQHEASRALGVSQQHIWGVLNGYRRSTGGYIFEYVDE